MLRQAGLAVLLLAGPFLVYPNAVFGQASALSAPRISNVPTTGIPQTQPPPQPDPTPINESSTSFLDSALPRNTVRLRFDIADYNRTPTLAEFFQPKGGIPGSPGPPIPERNIHYQELTTYAEYAPQPWFSIFFETPFLWLNPDFNRNEHGVGDLNLGFKLILWQDAPFLFTLQFRAYLPTSADSALGTNHVSIEPALLANWRITDFLTLEGDIRYWAPLGGTDFAGDVARYGLCLSYGQRSAGEIWITPMVEVVGWSVLGGKVMHATAPDQFTVDDVRSTFIFNAYLGARLGLGSNADFYVGYGRCLSGPSWYRDILRVEFRFLF
ncbi:MAG: transporter [Planctomycetes bacterium]|nr:transporter [Planctomycetota bacterium]